MAMEKQYMIRETHTRPLTTVGFNPARREILGEQTVVKARVPRVAAAQAIPQGDGLDGGRPEEEAVRVRRCRFPAMVLEGVGVADGDGDDAGVETRARLGGEGADVVVF